MKTIVLASLILLLSPSLPAKQPTADNSWEAMKFLLGKWVGEGSSEVGPGTGYFTFEEGLKGKVLIRKNYAEYPATKDRPAVTHEDLMVVYVETTTKKLQALYTDTEGNVIHYAITISGDGKSIVFLSDPQSAGPRYRLTYLVTQPDSLALTFEIAPPGQATEFKKFIEGKVRKVPNVK